MQKISDLAKTIEQKTKERAKNTETIVQNELSKLEQSLQQRLRESENIISDCIQQNTKQTKDKIKKITHYKLLIGGITGFLTAFIMILLGMMIWLGMEVQDKRKEIRALEQAIADTPTEQKFLAKVDITMTKTGKIQAIAKQPKKATAGLSSNKKPTLEVE